MHLLLTSLMTTLAFASGGTSTDWGVDNVLDGWSNNDISYGWNVAETVTRRGETAADGRLHTTIPLELPEARLTPELSLSTAEGHDPAMGWGWSLGVQSIQRSSADGPMDFDMGDRFVSPHGILVRVQVGVGSQVFYPELDTEGERAVYTYSVSSGSWSVTDTSGSTWTYEPTRSTAAGTVTWALTRHRNAADDVIDYAYDAEGLLTSITYGGNDRTGDAAELVVSLTYGARTCGVRSYRTGEEVVDADRLESVRVEMDGTLVRSWDFGYQSCPDRLHSIDRDAVGDNGTVLSERLYTFHYATSPSVVEESWSVPDELGLTISASGSYTSAGQTKTQLTTGSYNGDPLPDLLTPDGVAAGSTYDPVSDTHALSETVAGASSASTSDVATFLGEVTVMVGGYSTPVSYTCAQEMFTDVDGDGISDLVGTTGVSLGGGGGASFAMPTVEGQSCVSMWMSSDAFLLGADQHSYQVLSLMDIDGDGDQDIVVAAETDLEVYRWDHELGNWSATAESVAAAWCADVGWDAYIGRCATGRSVTEKIMGSSSTGAVTAGFFDVHGDGLSDFVVIDEDSSGVSWDIYANRADGFVSTAETWTDSTSPLPAALQTSQETSPNHQPSTDEYLGGACTWSMAGDFDGDGVSDIIDADAGLWYRNTGEGFEEQTIYEFFPSCMEQAQSKAWVIDPAEVSVLGDLDPAVFCNEEGCPVSTDLITNTLELDGLLLAGSVLRTRTLASSQDWDGDGMLDVLTTGGTLYSLQGGGYRLTRIERPAETTWIHYSSTGESHPSGVWSASQSLGQGFPVVSRTLRRDLVTQQLSSTTHDWSFGAYDRARREFQAFGEELITDSDGRQTLLERGTTFPWSGLEVERVDGEVLSGMGQDVGAPARTLTTTWIDMTRPLPMGGNPSVVPVLVRKDAELENLLPLAGGPLGTRNRERTFAYDTYGRLLETRLRGDTVSSGPFDDILLRNTWATGGTRGVEAVCISTVENLTAWGWLPQRTVRSSFDGLGFGCAIGDGFNDGLEIDRSGLGIGSSVVSMDIVRNAHGQISDIIRPSGATVSYGFDARSVHVSSTTSPVGLTWSATHDAWGNPVIATAPDGSQRITRRDGLGRITRDKRVDSLGTTHLVESVSWLDGATPMRESTSLVDGAREISWFNAHGDVYQERRFVPADDAPYAWVVVDHNYDGAGLEVAESRAYRGFGSSLSPTAASYWNTTEFDALGRVTQRTDAAGGVSQDLGHDAWSTHWVDAEGRARMEEFDARGNLVSAGVYAGGTTPMGASAYEWDALGKLTSVTDPDGQVTQLAWSSTGELLQISSPSIGTRTFAYDGDGHLLSKTDGNGNVVSYTRDADGRVLTVAHNGTVVETWTWDTVQPGMLTSVVDPAGTVVFAYDSLGRVAQETRTFAYGSSASRSMSYDAHDRPVQMVEPDGTVVDYTYSEGQLRQVELTLVDGTVSTVADFDVDPLGRVKGWTSDLGYDASLGYTLQGWSKAVTYTDSITGAITKELRTHDASGLVSDRMSIIDGRTRLTQHSHDAASRLVSSTGFESSSWTWSDGGDPQGMVDDAGVSWSFAQAPGTHRLDQWTDGSIANLVSYDAGGGVDAIDVVDLSSGTVVDSTLIARDARGRAVSALQGTLGLTRLYAFDGSIAEESVDGTTIRRLGDWETVGTDAVTTVRWGRHVLARVRNGTELERVFTDLQGTPMEVEDASGVHGLWTGAFGTELKTTGSPGAANHWLGLPRSSADLSSLGARMYSPAAMQFLSPDPLQVDENLVGFLTEPHALSPYNYAFNRPWDLMDPSGLAPEDDDTNQLVSDAITVVTTPSTLGGLRDLPGEVKSYGDFTPSQVNQAAEVAGQVTKTPAVRAASAAADGASVALNVVSLGIALDQGDSVGVMGSAAGLAEAAANKTGNVAASAVLNSFQLGLVAGDAVREFGESSSGGFTLADGFVLACQGAGSCENW